MVPYVLPGTSQLLSRQDDAYVSESGERFPIVDDIPRFVASESYAEAFGFQWNVYTETQLDSHTGTSISHDRLETCLGAELATLDGSDVLEAGCGAGRFTEHLVESGANVHACDLSAAVVANRSNIGERPNYSIAQANIYELPFAPHSFDVVFCIGVLQHLPSPERGIDSLYWLVKPGGRLVVDHYRRDLRLQIGALTRLETLYRQVLKRMPPERAKPIIDGAVDFFFPMQWALRDRPALRGLLNRISVCPFYYAEHPSLSKQQHYEWSKLDAFDTMTDYYKHKRTVGQIRRKLESLGAVEVWAQKGENGVQARCRRPAATGAG